jgi:hypothetical protein
MDNLMAVLRVVYDHAYAAGEQLVHIVAVEEANDYDPETRTVAEPAKAEAAYQRWRTERRPCDG